MRSSTHVFVPDAFARHFADGFRVIVALALAPWILHSSSRISRAGYITNISTVASVNTLAGPYTDSYTYSAGPASYFQAQSDASAGGGNATAIADTNLVLGSLAESNNSEISFDASSNATYDSGFSVLGLANGISLPLLFNFSMGGTLSASAAPGGLASAAVNYEVQTSTMTSRGGANLVNQGGHVSTIDTGIFAGAGTTLQGMTASQEFHPLMSIPVVYTSKDSLYVSLGTVASSSPNASAKALFRDTLTLDSITVPADFTGVDPSTLEVVFDSGLTMPVTRETVTPEPATGCLFGLGMIALLACRRRNETSVKLNRMGFN